MNVPWRFIISLFLGLVLGAGLFAGFLYSQLGIPTQSSSWALSLIQKKEALAAVIPGPRLLLVGGSGATFGLNAQVIEEQTGYRTVNMGSHAGLGLDYILYRAQKTARPGDTVLLILEYELYVNKFGNEQHDDYILARDPAFFYQMSWPDKIDMALRVPFKRFQKGWRNERHPENPPRPHPPYTDGAKYLTDYGDETGNAETDRPSSAPDLELVADSLVKGNSSDKTEGFNALGTFLPWAHDHHITVLATFPNILHRPEYDGPRGQETIKTITDFYTSRDIPVIGTAWEAMLPSDQFFDTFYHLTHEAALQRTERLVPELKPYLPSSH